MLTTSDRHLYERLENTPFALIEWDEQFRVLRWSQRASDIFGWQPSETVGKTPWEFHFVHEEDREHVAHLIQNLTGAGEAAQISHNRNYTKFGETKHCAWYNSALSAPGGDLKSYFSLIMDETDSLKTARELELQSERLAIALSAAQMGCWDWDLSSDRVVWTGAMESIFGYDAGQFDGRFESVLIRIHPEDTEKVITLIREAVREHRDYDSEYRLLLPGGEVRWVHCHGRPAYDLDGKPIRMMGTCVETTNRKSVEEDLKTAKASAETSNQLKSAFLANMSHEIRTPLGVILGFSELLADPEIEAAERAEYMGVIARNGEHLSRLIDDILDLSKVEAGKLDVHRSSLNVKRTLEDVCSSLQAKALNKGIALCLDFVGVLPEAIRTDVVRFKQVLINLIGNAVKFTDRGEVRVLAAFEATRSLLKIRVQDSGVGISEEGQTTLFEPFAQADRTITRRFGGTGLGLALSRKIARSLSGDLTLVHSAVGRGSLFEFTLPVASVIKRLEPDQEGRAQLSAKPLKNLRILLAEDAPDNQVLMDRILRKRGATLAIASDGGEAVERALGGEFDIVLMDIQMPKVDGYEATRKLREQGFSKPIIALTAHAMKEERNRCLSAGCNDHLSKPVNPRDLVEILLKFAKTTGREVELEGPANRA